MHRNAILSLLHSYNPTDCNEHNNKRVIIEFIERYDMCFERFLDVGHIVASAWLLNKDHTKALLMHHAKLDMWIQLGGHCDGNSDVLAVAIREAQEESGISDIVPLTHDIFDIDVHLVPANSKEKEHYHYDMRFLLAATDDDQVIKNNESKELRWIDKSLNELPTESESVVRMVRKWISL